MSRHAKKCTYRLSEILCSEPYEFGRPLECESPKDFGNPVGNTNSLVETFLERRNLKVKIPWAQSCQLIGEKETLSAYGPPFLHRNQSFSFHFLEGPHFY